ncbi:MAG: hypothetical protein ACRDHF_20230, partial [Tepidiformaceae bacterium]
MRAGRGVPIMGPGDYFALSEQDAKRYGAVTLENVELRRPFVLDSDAKWNQLLRSSGAMHLHSASGLFVTDPQGVEPATKRVQKYLRDKGYDGVVVQLTPRDDSDKTRRLNESFGHSQVIRFRAAPAPVRGQVSPGAEETPVGPPGRPIQLGPSAAAERETLNPSDPLSVARWVKARGGISLPAESDLAGEYATIPSG